MHALFIHRAFPAQFRYVAPRLAARGWECTFVIREQSSGTGTGAQEWGAQEWGQKPNAAA